MSEARGNLDCDICHPEMHVDCGWEHHWRCAKHRRPGTLPQPTNQ